MALRTRFLNHRGAEALRFLLLFVSVSLWCNLQPLFSFQPVDFTCPMDKDVRSKGPGKCPRCGMKLAPAIREQQEYPLQLTSKPRAIRAGEPVRLEFRVSDPSGAPVDKFEVIHEREFHLFLVSGDLGWFRHEHPEHRRGTFVLETKLPKPGAYRLLADFYPAGGTPQLTPLTLITAGYLAPQAPAALAPDLAPKKGPNLEASLATEPPQPIAGKKTMLFFKLRPAQGLEPYLGAWGHLLAVSNDLVDAIHEHPFLASGGDIQFNIFFPREATYRIWVQFQREGQVNTVEFTVPVSKLK